MAQKKGTKDQTEARYASRRRTVLRAARKSSPVDAMLVTNATDIRYLCGVTEGSQSFLFGDNWGYQNGVILGPDLWVLTQRWVRRLSWHRAFR